ncbi:uncharacterized protein LOC129905265 [Episyrphus balteatus]|uniref:uncharacterized protein LOC129905265 n=1 Tax=Episyrphus balteatus TaxID=286459 RepID=UPI002485399A|nr:uncharacterized protein LOC129905265 [Episyrphus balteatus]
MEIDPIDSDTDSKFSLSLLDDFHELDQFQDSEKHENLFNREIKIEKNYDDDEDFENANDCKNNKVIIKTEYDSDHENDKEHYDDVDDDNDNNVNDDNETTQTEDPLASSCQEEIDDEEEAKPSSSSSSNSNRAINSLSLTNQILFDGKYYTLKSKNAQFLVGACKLCQPNHIVRGSTFSSSNFRRHLKRYHGDWVVDELNEHILSERSRLDESYSPKKGNSILKEILEHKVTKKRSLPSSNSNNNPLTKGLTLTYQVLFDGHFYLLKYVSDKLLVANCLLCVPNRVVRGNFNSSSNFRAHLRRNHGEWTMDELNRRYCLKRTEMPEKHSNRRRLLYSPNEKPKIEKGTPTPPELIKTLIPIKISTSATSTSAEVATSSIKQVKTFNGKVLNYFLKSFVPLSAVESPEFWTMFDSEMPLISEEELIKQIKSKSMILKSKIISLLESVNYACTTIDSWSSKSHNYLAITCHWIDAVNLKRRSMALACKRFDNFISQNHAEAIFQATLSRYNLPMNKIVSNVTKNCYNFSQTFNDLNINTTFKPDVINENHSVPFQIKELLPYICYTNTLSIIATIDIPHVINSDRKLKLINDSTMKKVFQFLSLASSHPTLSPMMVDLKKPNVSKWNSIYNSIDYVLNFGKKYKFTELFQLIKCEPFTINEVKYLREYVKCLHPLAMAFERLQCEEGTYQGFILPTLLEMRKKCEKLLECNDIVMCKPILKTIILAKTKFQEFSKQSRHYLPAAFASLSHPFFKEKWLSYIDKTKRDKMRTLFIEAVKKENSKSSNVAAAGNSNQQVDNKNEQKIDDFYFGDESPENNAKECVSVELEALRYLGDERRELKMLDDYPAVKRVFLKHNTALSSSEPVEILFPFETRHHIARFGYLADEFFEERVLLSVNKNEFVL